MRLDKGRWTREHHELLALIAKTFDVEREYLVEQLFMGIPFVPFDVAVIVLSRQSA